MTILAPLPPERWAVEVRDLGVSLADMRIPVIADVAFSVGPGEILGVVGESGSGKSTLALALLGFARPGLRITSGSVRIGPLDMLALDARSVQRARGHIVSYVPQDPASSLNPAHRVGAQLREVLEVHHRDLGELDVEGRVEELLDEVALPRAILTSYPHQMSGGQQQRIAIAIAFACRPRLIVLDEPTTGLDVTTQRHILDVIRTLARSHEVSGVYVSHDLPAVGQVASSTAVMYGGRVVEQGPTDRLFTEPRHPYTAGLLAAAPSAERSTRLVGIEGHPRRPGRWPTGCSFANRCPHATDACAAGVPQLEEIASRRTLRCVHPLPDGTLAALTRLPVPSVEIQLGSGVEVRGVSAHYGGRPVLHDVTFDVPPGMCTAIVGESGSGKTTLARCIAGLHSRWDGEIRLDKTPLARGAARRTNGQRRAMQYVFQNPFGSLNPTMTVTENIEEPLRQFERLSRSERRHRVLEALESVSLSEEFADRLPAQLSGGERQRVAVARGLVVEPNILICDEITSALDVSVQAILVEQLRDLQLTRGLAMIFITHNLALVRSLAQHMTVLQDGRVVERGPVARVLDDPHHRYTRQLLDDIPRLADAASEKKTA